MSSHRHLQRALLTAAASATLLVPVANAAASATAVDVSASQQQHTEPAARAAKTWKGNLAAAIKKIPTAAEVRTGYNRDLFPLWVDADSDCLDTREEVLLVEATTKPSTSSCAISGGAWYSYYDGVTTTDSSTFDIDHLVPLAEAWDSGARTWDTDTRTRYANDLGDPRPLVAVSASSNRSKSDQDPAEWMPPLAATDKVVECRYIRDWAAIKIRWGLSADAAEKSTLTSYVDDCGSTKFKIAYASVTKIDAPGSGGGGGGGTGGGTSSAETLTITRVVYDPAGSDTDANVNAETVTLTNTGATALKIQGWRLSDAAAHTFVFPTATVPAGGTVTIHSGTGSTSGSGTNAVDLYAGWGHVWNNSGDTVTVTRPDASQSDSKTYPGGGSGTITY